MQYRGKRKRDYLRRVEFAFYNEAEIRRAVREKRLDRGVKASGARGGFSDPTASAAIAAASILAKVSRDRCMCALAETYPQYGFEKHKGYGTKAHYEALRACGPSPVHRRTFLRKMH